MDIAYRDVALATENNLIKLAETIIELRKPVASEWTKYELVIQKMRHFFGLHGSNLMLKISSYGRDEAEAGKIFNVQCQIMGKTFEAIK